MVAHIKTLKEDNGDIVYPITTPEAVNYDGDSSDVIKGDGTAGKVTASNIANNAVKANNIDFTTFPTEESVDVVMMYNSKFRCRRTLLPSGDWLVTIHQTTTSGNISSDGDSTETIPSKYRPNYTVVAPFSGWASGTGWNYGQIAIRNTGVMTWKLASAQATSIWNASFTFIKKAS